VCAVRGVAANVEFGAGSGGGATFSLVGEENVERGSVRRRNSTFAVGEPANRRIPAGPAAGCDVLLPLGVKRRTRREGAPKCDVLHVRPRSNPPSMPAVDDVCALWPHNVERERATAVGSTFCALWPHNVGRERATAVGSTFCALWPHNVEREGPAAADATFAASEVQNVEFARRSTLPSTFRTDAVHNVERDRRTTGLSTFCIRPRTRRPNRTRPLNAAVDVHRPRRTHATRSRHADPRAGQHADFATTLHQLGTDSRAPGRDPAPRP
jgi:hypothetical protein